VIAGANQVVDGVSGFVVRARNPTALVDRLDELLADSTLRSHMGRAVYAKTDSHTLEDYGLRVDERVLALLVGAWIT
jgi:glycosyltransferase involved in cell wall biosynthesis